MADTFESNSPGARFRLAVAQERPLQVAGAIYRDPVLSGYAMAALPPIHIVVENGHVTLTGTVNSDMEKQIAGMRAASGLSFGPVVNNLVVEHPAKKS